MADCLIVGTGAMACLFGARLAAVGTRVTMLGTWRAGLDALNGQGVRLVERDGSERTYPVRATDDPADCRGARLALVLVKAWQTPRAAMQLSHCLAPEGLATTLQNGLGNREELARLLGEERVALGVTTFGATLLGPGHVRAGGDGIVSLGARNAGETPAPLESLEGLLRASSFPVKIVADADALLWGKLVINAAINPLTALLRVSNGELLERPSASELMAEAALEAAAVAKAVGMHLSAADPAQAARWVAQRTAANHSSMLQDVMRDAPTEIDAICGAITAYGERHGVPTPVNRLLWMLVKALKKEAE
jgi:2-dehydropantoate 2-reductase